MTNITLILAFGLFAFGAVVARSFFGGSDTEVAEGPAVTPGTYELDPAHSEIGFRVKHLGISTVKGSFAEGAATISFPSTDLAEMKVEGTVAAKSIDTNNADRDEHLRSADFFDVEQHPTITFTSREVTPEADGRFTLKGDLTMRGVTRQIELSGEYLGTAVDPWGNQKVAISAEGTINRKDFGLTWNKALEAGGVLVGENVTIVLDVQAVGSVSSK